jgi:hypothetical protein
MAGASQSGWPSVDLDDQLHDLSVQCITLDRCSQYEKGRQVPFPFGRHVLLCTMSLCHSFVWSFGAIVLRRGNRSLCFPQAQVHDTEIGHVP